MFPHVALHCVNCGATSLLPWHMLSQPFEGPDRPPRDARAIGLACPVCKQVRTHFLNEKHPKHDPKSTVVLLENRRVNTVHVCTLKCVAADCRTPVPVFAQRTLATTVQEHEADALTWTWEHLCCPKGHRTESPIFPQPPFPPASEATEF